MNILDKLFSREIQRRTGARAISIYIDSNTKTRKRSRAIGSSALNATKVTTKHRQGSLFHRLNVRLPWLKLVAVCILGLIVILDLLDVTIPKTNDPAGHIKIAPMARHVRATERTTEGKKLAALTFDDGPSPATTPRLLDLLAEKDAPATFFMLGNMARANPELVQRIEKEHHEVASHTMYHQNLVNLPAATAAADINEAKSVIRSITGHDPTYTRPPYGNFNAAVASSVGSPIILWSVDTEDWLSKDTNTIVATTMSEVYDGAIILMHDIYPTSVEAVPTLIDTLRDAGYEFVTISELAKLRGVDLAPGSAYYSLRP